MFNICCLETLALMNPRFSHSYKTALNLATGKITKEQAINDLGVNGIENEVLKKDIMRKIEALEDSRDKGGRKWIKQPK